MNNHNFITPKGLKIRLDLSYFMKYITGEDREYTHYETEAHPVMQNIASMTETRFLLPSALKWFFTVIVLFARPDTSIAEYLLMSSILFLYGCIFRLMPPFGILAFVEIILTTIFRYVSLIWQLIPYIVIILIGIITENIPLTIASFIASAIYGIFNTLIINNIVSSVTKKKYGYAFNDTEICGLATIYCVLNQNIGFKKFIQDYCVHALHVYPNVSLKELHKLYNNNTE